MTIQELIERFERGTKRAHVIGGEQAGVVAGLDLEGRLYAVLNGEVLNRVNPEALTGISSQQAYLNPGGDGLWPAPEGTCMGYQYATGGWRVPPGLSGARYRLTQSAANSATLRAEIDLINSRGQGIPVAFQRSVRIEHDANALTMTVVESIEYLGDRELAESEFGLAPWTLAQFDCGPGCEVVFPRVDRSAIWDLYDPSDACRFEQGDGWHTRTDGTMRYQIALGPDVPWIEFRDPQRGLAVRRVAEPPHRGHEYIDIADAPPDTTPGDKGVRYSVYSDTDGFMEIEAAGAQPSRLRPGDVLSVCVTTTYRMAAE